MVDYRIYSLDGDGRIGFADWISADNDEDAIVQARNLKPDAQRCEIWQGKRLVAKLSPSRFSPDDPDLQNAVGDRLSALALRMKLGLEAEPDAAMS